jgi:hypothetical protein
MKKFSLLHNLKSMTFLVMLALTFSLASCSTDEPDSPNVLTPTVGNGTHPGNPSDNDSSDDSSDDEQDMGRDLLVTELPGEWIIESITDEEGHKTDINITFNVLPFEVDPTSDVVSTINWPGGLIYWGENKENIISYTTSNGVITENAILTLLIPKDYTSVSEAYIKTMAFFVYDNNNVARSISCLSVSYHENIVTADGGIGFYTTENLNNRTITGTITMKKIK